MSEVLKKLTERKTALFSEMSAVADAATAENRSFSGEEQSKWDKLNADYAEARKLADEYTAAEKDATEATRAYEELSKKTSETRKTEDRSDADKLAAFVRGEAGRALELGGKVDMRALVKGTASAGGNTVPTSFYGQLVEHMTEQSAVLRSGATIMNTASGEALQVPKTTAHAAASIVAEAAQLSTSEPTFGQVTLTSYKYGFTFDLSPELMADTGVALESYLARMSGEALGNAFGAHAIVGTGTNQPRGILADAPAGVTGPAGVAGGFGTQSTAGQGGDLLISLYHSVIEPYRRSASCGWLMNDDTAAAVRKLKNSQGDYIWQPGLVAGSPDTILGKPVLIDPNMPDVGVGNESIVFGDFSKYFVRLVGPIRFERSEDFKFDYDLVSFRALMRADARMVDLTGALKTFTGGAAE